MTIWHRSLKDRISSFPVKDHILMVCNELNRAQNLIVDEKEYRNAIERAMEILQYSIESGIWKGKYREIVRARSIIAEQYISTPKTTEKLQTMLFQLSPDAWNMMHD